MAEILYIDTLAIETAAQKLTEEKVSSFNKYIKQSTRTNIRFIKKLAKQEKRLKAKLINSDSLMHERFEKVASISFDSMQRKLENISYLSKEKVVKSKLQLGIDSLSKLSTFLSNNSLGVIDPAMSREIDKIKEQLALQELLKSAIQQRSKSLSQLFSNSKYTKQSQQLAQLSAQYKAQLSYWESLTTNPNHAEEKALEYLRGIDGFEQALSTDSKKAGIGIKSEEELRRLGYQTRKSTEESLQESFGAELQRVKEQVAQSVQQYTETLARNVIVGSKMKTIHETVEKVNTGKELLVDGKRQGSRLLKGNQKTNMLKNPLKGVPLRFRWAIDFNYQVHRAAKEEGKPSILQVGLNIGYKQNPDLTLGFGLDGSMGLGQSWKELRISYEGLVTRVFLNHKLVWNFFLEGGYEKSVRPLDREYSNTMLHYGNKGNVKTAMGLLHDAAYLGLQKRYKLNNKLQGSLLIGYNFLNDKTKINSPWIIRMGWKI